MNNVKMIAVAVVAILVVVAAAAFFIGGGEDESQGDTVTIVQNDGKEVEVAVPVQKLCIVNTNAAEFATILGVSDRVVGVSSSMKDEPTESWWAERTDIGTYKTPTPDKILETGSTVIIGQCTSMPITNVEALEQQGITVILLDMFGYETQSDDLKQFAKLFPDTDAADVADRYGEFLDGIVDDITTKTKGIADSDRMTFISSMGTSGSSKYYTVNAELSGLLENVCGMKNSMANLSTSSSSTAAVGEDSIVKEYNTNGIDTFILRNSTPYDEAASDIETFLSTHPIIKSEGMFDEMNIVKTIDSKTLSGARCFIGMVYFAGFANPSIDFGMTIESVVADYNSQFGTSWTSDKLFYEA